MGQRVGLLETFRGAFGLAVDGGGDAESCGRSFTLDRGNTVRRGQRAPLECDIGAFLGGDGLFDCVWVDGRVYGLHLHPEEEHGDASGDLCVCESSGGALSWVALGYLIVFGSMIGFTAYIYILKKSTATRVATYAFVNPVVALFLGWLFIGESINLRTIIAAAVILTAVLLVITAPHPAPQPAKSAAAQVAEA